MVKHKDKPSAFETENRSLNHTLILYNDEVNTFDFFIETLIEVCFHEPEQAEQCAMITHFKGKCDVKSGDYHDLKPMSEEMTIRGLTVSIQQ